MTPDTPAGGAVAAIDAVVAEMRLEAKDAAESGEDMSVMREWASRLARISRKLAKPKPATVSADAVLALVERLSEPRTLSQFMGPHDMALALIEERNAIRDELEALTRGEGK